jgi:hypothetical protein
LKIFLKSGVYAGNNDSDDFELFYYFEKKRNKLCYLNLDTKEFATITFGFK